MLRSCWDYHRVPEQTTIACALPEASVVRLAVYDLLGRAVARLVEGPMEAGRHTVQFDVVDLPSGMYLYRLEAGACHVGAPRRRRDS